MEQNLIFTSYNEGRLQVKFRDHSNMIGPLHEVISSGEQLFEEQETNFANHHITFRVTIHLYKTAYKY